MTNLEAVLISANRRIAAELLADLAAIIAEWDGLLDGSTCSGSISQDRHGADYMERVAKVMRGDRPLHRVKG